MTKSIKCYFLIESAALPLLIFITKFIITTTTEFTFPNLIYTFVEYTDS